MAIQRGGRGGNTTGPRPVRSQGGEGFLGIDIPAPITESLRQQFTDELRVVFRKASVKPDLIYAFSKTGRVVTEENRVHLSVAQYREWKRALREYRLRAEADARGVDLCYTLHHESSRSDLSNKRRFAASELGVAVLNALEEEISSFAMEGVFLNAWLTLVCRRVRAFTEDADELRQRFGADMAEIRALFDEIYDEQPSPSWSPAIEKRIARIEAARAVPETWLGKPPTSNAEAEWEMIPAFEHLQSAIQFCNVANVPEDIMDAMFLRFWLRTLVLNDRLPELFFQTLDKDWELVHARVQSHMARYAGPRFQ